MEIVALALLVGAASAFKLVSPIPKHGADFTISRIPSARKPLEPAELKVTHHVVNLRRGNSRSLSSVYVQALRQQAMVALQGNERPSNGSAQLVPVEAGEVFLAPIAVGNQNFDVVVDTGSSDPWLVGPGFACIDPYDGTVQDEQECYFGPTYNSSASTTFSQIPNENFNISYADGEMLNGVMGHETMTLGGITVPAQEFGLVNYAAWYGDGVSSGLVGFAYGTLTSAYRGTNPSGDQRGATLMYNPLFVNMYNQSSVAPVFSLAIDRDPQNGGVLALGGIPNIPHSPYWVSTPISSVGVFSGTTTPAYEFYTIDADGFAYSASPFTQYNVEDTNNPRKTNITAPGSVIVDSGTSLVYAPDEVAAGVAAAFNPPGSYNSDAAAWYVSCTAASPVFGVSIGKKIFYVNGQDLIVPSSEGQCISGVQPNMGGLTILGDVWMKNVISVFDIGAEQLRFASREYYGLTSTSKSATT